MVYVTFIASALATAVLFAVAARVMMGIEHTGILVAIGVMGGCLHIFVLIAWYLYRTRDIGAVDPAERASDTGVSKRSG